MPNGSGLNPYDLLDNLKKSGFNPKQAEALAKILTDMESQSVATKQDLEITKLELKQDIKELDLKIESVRADLKRDIETVKSELGRDIKELESRMKLHMIITSGGTAFFILTALVTLAKLGLLTPSAS